MEEYMIYKPEIRFADIDSYGIVHNAKFLLFFEESRINLLRTLQEFGIGKREEFLLHPKKLITDIQLH